MSSMHLTECVLARPRSCAYIGSCGQRVLVGGDRGSLHLCGLQTVRLVASTELALLPRSQSPMSARRAAKRLVSHRVVQASGPVQQAKPIAFLPCALTNGNMFLGLAADLSLRGFQSWSVRADCLASVGLAVSKWLSEA